MGVGEPWYLCRRSKVMLWWKRPRPPSKNPIEGVEGVAPEPSSLRETTIENEGCRATPLHLRRRPQEPVALCRREVAKVDGGVVVGLACSRSLTDNREVER